TTTGKREGSELVGSKLKWISKMWAEERCGQQIEWLEKERIGEKERMLVVSRVWENGFLGEMLCLR
ncbi:hypothetical protein Tco_1322921, partial [Tanacetum coccineum]